MPARRIKRFSLRAFLRDLPIARKLTLVIALFCIIILKLLVLGYFGMEILSGSRAYVGGEGLWSKAQKGAVYRLTRYAMFHDEADYREYLEHIAVSQGDRMARLELARPDMDQAVVARGFIQGRNHPDDVRIMAFMARHFHNFPYMREAIDLWSDADWRLDELQAVAKNLRMEITSGAPSQARIRELLERINVIDGQLTRIEDEFSYTLGEGARWLKRSVFLVMLAFTVLFLAKVLSVAVFISRHLSREIEQLRAGAARIADGDYSIALNVAARDEIGDLARSFQEMAAHRQQAERVKDEFFANVSHELRTPLTLILAPLESLLAGDHGPLDERATPALRTMHNNTLRLLQLVNGLLDFSRLEAGQLHVNREPVCILGITQTMLADFKPLLRERHLDARLNADCPLHAVMVDRYLYERILFNLLSNAMKFTPSYGRIDIDVSWQAGQVRLKVTDTGIGIAPEQLKTIFERFRQVEGSSTRRFEGTGLGLALIKEFSELLDGGVQVDSTPGQGSTFIVTFAAPATFEAAAASVTSATVAALPQHPAPLLTAPLSITTQPPANGAAVLIAEDNVEMASYIASLIQPLATVKIARDGEAALRIIRNEPIELILTDVMMPGRDGIDLCRQVKAQPQTASIPVVMITALTHREALLEGWKAGADEYLFKPFHPRELLTRVQSLLKTARNKREADEHIALLNHALARRATDLEAANRELESFSYSVSHDLRGPLRIVAGYSQMLMETCAQSLDEPGQRMLAQISGATQRMDQLIEDLLQLSRISLAEPVRAPVNLSTIAGDVIQELNLREGARDIKLIIDPDLHAHADARLMRVVLDNLLGNAWKFTRRTLEPQIQLGMEARDGVETFFVRDNGAGFDMNFAHKLFMPFQRLHDPGHFPGTGVGLATVRRVIERHHGRIWAESEVDRGTTFYFTLGEAPGKEQGEVESGPTDLPQA